MVQKIFDLIFIPLKFQNIPCISKLSRVYFDIKARLADEVQRPSHGPVGLARWIACQTKKYKMKYSSQVSFLEMTKGHTHPRPAYSLAKVYIAAASHSMWCHYGTHAMP
jgi:hypothetical protein